MVDITTLSFSDMRLIAAAIACTIGIVMMLIVTGNAKKNRRLSFLDDKMFYLLAILTLVLCVLEFLTVLVDTRRFIADVAVSRILNTLLFIVGEFPGVVWVLYVEYKITEDKERFKKILPYLLIIPCAFSLLSIFNLWFDIFFSISAENVYGRTWFSYVPIVISFLYVVGAAIRIIMCRKSFKRYMFLPMFAFLFAPIIGSLIQVIFYGISLTWLSVGLGVLVVYLNVQNETSAVDALTGLYSRLQLDAYMRSECSKKQSELKLFGIMLDIDKFQSINDNYGHTAGDDALANFGKILADSAGSKAFVARYAGDEFVMLMYAQDSMDVEMLISGLRGNTMRFNNRGKKPYKLDFSIGYTCFNFGDDTTDKFIKRMDDAMYKEKNAKKSVF